MPRIQNEEKVSFSKNGVEKTRYPHTKYEWEPSLRPITKINLRWIKTNVGPEAVIFLEDNIGRKFLDTGFGNTLLNMTPEAQAKEQK